LREICGGLSLALLRPDPTGLSRCPAPLTRKNKSVYNTPQAEPPKSEKSERSESVSLNEKLAVEPYTETTHIKEEVPELPVSEPDESPAWEKLVLENPIVEHPDSELPISELLVDEDPFSYDIGGEDTDTPFGNISFPDKEPEEDEKNEDSPQGLYTPRGNIGWESYTHDRLASELHRCASFEQDLVFLVIEYKSNEKMEDNQYREFAEEAVGFFAMRDLIFERGENGISIIIPNINLDQGMQKSEDFRSRIYANFPASFENKGKILIGLSSRSGRLIEADRLMLRLQKEEHEKEADMDVKRAELRARQALKIEQISDRLVKEVLESHGNC